MDEKIFTTDSDSHTWPVYFPVFALKGGNVQG